MTQPPKWSRLIASLTQAEGVSFKYSNSSRVGELFPVVIFPPLRVFLFLMTNIRDFVAMAVLTPFDALRA
jgi:hypothetical protein